MVLTDRVLMVVWPGKLNSRLVFPFIYILFVYTYALTTVPIHISVWNFGFGSGLGVNSFEVGRFIPVTCIGLLLTVTWLRLCALEVKVYWSRTHSFGYFGIQRINKCQAKNFNSWLPLGLRVWLKRTRAAAISVVGLSFLGLLDFGLSSTIGC